MRATTTTTWSRGEEFVLGVASRGSKDLSTAMYLLG